MVYFRREKTVVNKERTHFYLTGQPFVWSNDPQEDIRIDCR